MLQMHTVRDQAQTENEGTSPSQRVPVLTTVITQSSAHQSNKWSLFCVYRNAIFHSDVAQIRAADFSTFFLPKLRIAAVCYYVNEGGNNRFFTLFFKQTGLQTGLCNETKNSSMAAMTLPMNHLPPPPTKILPLLYFS